MALPLDFALVLAAFAHPVLLPVCDTTGRYLAGRWTEDLPLRRDKDLSAIVLAMEPARLAFLTEGEASSSGLVLHTREQLYFSDVTAHGLEQRQSYVEYQGYRFRVVGRGFFYGNTRGGLYECLRHPR